MHVADRIAHHPDITDPRRPNCELNLEYLEKHSRADKWNEWREACAPTPSPGKRLSVKDRVLFVDDEPNVLDGIRRQLRNRVELETANSAAAGLDIIESQGPFAVVVSDMRMPEMDGARFLAKRQRDRAADRAHGALRPGRPRIDHRRRQRRPRVPFPAEALQLRNACSASIKNGIEQYRLINAEKHLLENTLNATVKVLVNVLGTHQSRGAAARRADPELRRERRAWRSG